MSAFTAVNLSRLPALDLIEPLDFETILARLIDALRARYPAFDAVLESDPAIKLAEVAAYAELLLRQRINEAAKSVMLAYATGTALDHIAAGYNVERQVITPANPAAFPPVPAVLEPDDELRRRVQLAFEGFSTAGPDGSYIFHALGAHADVLDASVASPSPGEVVVTVLSRSNGGTPAADVLAAVAATLNADRVRPLTDHVSVQPAVIVPWALDADLSLWPGPDAAVVEAAAQANIAAYLAGQQRLGRSIHRSALLAALHVEGVRSVLLASPSMDVLLDATQCGHCTNVNIKAVAQ